MPEKEMLEIIYSHSEGILQSEIRKLMEIDSKKCSRIVSKLMKEHLIRREDELAEGRKTYRLFPIGFTGPSERHLKLIANGIFSPCTGCDLECYPETCYLLNGWVLAVIAEEA